LKAEAVPVINLRLSFHPLTKEKWKDFEKLFGEKGACGGCWCMWWRIRRSEYDKHKGNGNRKAMKKIVNSGAAPGIIAFSGTEPVGWCSVGPRESYPVMENSRILGRIDDQAVWSIVCLFIKKSFRRHGLSSRLIKAAADYAFASGAKIVEGYPVEPKDKKMPDVFAFTGLAASFKKAGFKEVLRRSETRPLMRLAGGKS
jgi:GNAT superfamily N-acetyltransferase